MGQSQLLSFIRRQLSPPLMAQNSLLPLVIFVPLTPIFHIQYQLPSCYIWETPASAVEKFLFSSTGWIECFASGPLPYLSSVLKTSLMSPKLTCMLIYPLNIEHCFQAKHCKLLQCKECHWLLLVNNCRIVK